MPKKLIGRGHFSTCYLNECGKTVTIISRDEAKEAAAQLGFPNSTLFAPIELIERLDNGKSKYIMEYLPYNRSLKKALKPDQWELYKTLEKLHKDNCWGCYLKGETGYNKWWRLFNTLPESLVDVKNDLLDALTVLSNYQDCIAFEVSLRNVRAKNGNLVLLDCFFFTSQVKW